ncbi:hypothetical protein BGZ93_000210 [Podila epicladia]|nr:hypothetical protein BGZ92_001156 [Podila epicladia]KAG0086267.1 hypothetical protein BGZ93_000210 [Podila epicladia]
MKFAFASLALVAAVSAQSVGPVDPSKLGTGWCSMYTGASCADVIVPGACGVNATFTAHCKSTFSQDKVCMDFQATCACTPKAGGELKDLSFEAFNKTFELMPYGMCNNLLWTKNTTGPGIVSGDYKPDGKRPAQPAATPKANGSTTATPAPSATPAAGSSIQVAVSTIALAAISLGLAML